jgi:hypothetical protein
LAHNDRAGSVGSDPLTIVFVSLLALAGAGAVVVCLVYAVWRLLNFWAPF